MYRWQGLADVPAEWGASVVTIGVFDGVHRGHQRIIARGADVAAGLGLPLVVITFDPHPDEVIRPGSHPLLLCTLQCRVDLLAGLGAGAVCVLPFTAELSRLSPEEFARWALVDRLHAGAVVVGENFRFGHRAAGDVEGLARLGDAYGFTAHGVPLLDRAGEAISSSGIRRKLAEGDVAGAARDLGRPHRVEGTVVPGHRRGRAMGFPTANLQAPPYTAIPADGVYAGWLTRLPRPSGAGSVAAGAGNAGTAAGSDDTGTAPDAAGVGPWPAAISVGTNPTFDGKDRVVEAYALDADDLDLYGAYVAVDFTERLRGMLRFSSAAELADRMREDVRKVRELMPPPGGRSPLAPPAAGQAR